MKTKNLILLIISVLLVLISCKNNDSAVDIFSDGKTEYTIVYAEDAPDEAVALAKELAELSGADLDVVSDTSEEKTFEILIGNTNRAQTAALKPYLEEKMTISAFSYIVAEKDGKLVILADDEVGYIYALEYIKTTYIKDGKFTVTAGIRDVQQIAQEHYYNSDLYYDRLLAEADKDSYDFIKEQLDKEIGRYDDKGNSITTLAEAIEGYTKLISSFKTVDFGEYTASIFKSKESLYSDPTIYPDDEHPRLLFRESELPRLRENLSAEQNAVQYKKYIALSNVFSDGRFSDISGDMKHNYSYNVVAKIEADAYRYIMEKDSDDKSVAASAVLYGYEAIYAIKNAILSVEIPHTIGDCARAYGHILYVTACVYDWCYELMTDVDKAQIIAGAVNILGRGLEIVRYDGKTNLVPTAQDPVSDHGAEYQLLSDYFSFAIACYNEAPEIYDVVGGRILNNYADYQNYFAQSGTYWQGVYYTGFRAPSSVMANIMVKNMKDEDVELPFKYTEEMAITQTYSYRPDGYIFMSGDVGQNQGRGYEYTYDSTYMFLTASLHGNSYLKSYAYEYSKGFSNFYGTTGDTSLYKGAGGVTAVQFLAINDPDIDYVYNGPVNLTHTTSFPYTNIFAKSANDDKTAYAVYMTMQDMFVTSHGHLDCGSFQIAYNGAILASDSGAYIPWGGTHHMGYVMQTVAHNSVLVYNPKYDGTTNETYSNMIYSGGQSIYKIDASVTFQSLKEYLAYVKTNQRYVQCTSLGKANVEVEIDGKQVYLYSYMGGDMTNAYDADTVNDVTRYMISVATGDEACPYVFITFDRITSEDATFKKTVLLHSETEPVLTNDGCAIITNGDGKLVVQNVGFDNTYTKVGGPGQEFMVNGVNMPITEKLYGTEAEYGWGRIEISPTEQNLTDYVMTVMYVTDASNGAAPVAAAEAAVVSGNLVGTEILSKAIFFPKDKGEEGGLLTDAVTFTLTSADECFVAGVKAGDWTIIKDGVTLETVTVKAGENLINFVAGAGTYTITPAN